nr:hypothetical protein [Tanacetum cinerariifolium]
MDFRSFMVQGIYGKFNFLLEGGLDENQSSTKSMNNKSSMINVKPISAVHPSDIAEYIMDSRNTSSEEGGLSPISPDAPSYLEVGKRSKDSRTDCIKPGHSVILFEKRKSRKIKRTQSWRKKCNEAFQDLDKIPLVFYMRAKIECHTPSSAETREYD